MISQNFCQKSKWRFAKLRNADCVDEGKIHRISVFHKINTILSKKHYVSSYNVWIQNILQNQLTITAIQQKNTHFTILAFQKEKKIKKKK